MNYNPLTRRMFLRGVGGALMLPLLPSLLPKAYAATAPTAASSIRYLQLMQTFGMFGANFHPSDARLKLVDRGDGVRSQRLSELTGDISVVLGKEFNPYRNKMSLVRGITVLAGSFIHNASFATAGSGTAGPGDRSAPLFPYSIDAILADSKKINPSTVGIQKHVNISPARASFSWTKIAGKTQTLAPIEATDPLMALFTTLTANTPEITAIKTRQSDVVQAVFDDYKRVRNNDRLSSADKERLDAYVEHIDETQRGLNGSAIACGEPVKKDEPIAAEGVALTDEQRAVYTQNRMNIMVAMLACGLTRVGAMSLGGGNGTGGSGNIHEDTHDNRVAVQGTYHRANALNIAYLMGKLDGIPDVNGTLFDNTLMYWSNEFGEIEYRSPHRPTDMPIVVAGGAGGRLRMGEYIDFSTGVGVAQKGVTGAKRGGLKRRPMNNFLITMLNAMGLSSGDYEREGVIGFGEYNEAQIAANVLPEYVTGTDARRAALPYLYQGPALG